MSDSIDVPIVCSLGERAALDDRLHEWQELLKCAVERDTIEDGVRLVFATHADVVAEVGRLTALEAACCAWMDFTVHVGHDRTTVDVRAPAEGVDLVVKLFGP